jgi:hypothetical protein
MSEVDTRRWEAWTGAKRCQLAFGPLWGRPWVWGRRPTVRIRVLLYNSIVSRQNRSRHSCKHSTKIVKVMAS